MSEMRGTTVFSLVVTVRRSAFDTTFSSTLIGSRCDTPERRSTRLSSGASKGTRSLRAATQSGSLGGGTLGPRHGSWRVVGEPDTTGWGGWGTVSETVRFL